MATCAVIGEAAGTGAALSVEKGITPRELHRGHLRELQQTMLKQDASIIGLRNEDAADLALQATVNASSALARLALETPAEAWPLKSDMGLLLPADPDIGGIELLVDAEDAATLTVELWDTGRGENYVPRALQASSSAKVGKGAKQWVKLDLSWTPDAPQNAFLVIKADERLSLHLSDRPQTGVLAFVKGPSPAVSADLEDHQPSQPVMQWSMRPLVRKPFCFRLLSPTSAFSAEKAVDGYQRPFAGPRMWSSAALREDAPEWLELSWAKQVSVRSVHVTFNDDVNEDLINLHHHRTPFAVLPELVRNYTVEAYANGEWTAVAEGQNNHKRKHVHTLGAAVSADKLRISVYSTNGSPCAEIVEVRVYE